MTNKKILTLISLLLLFSFLMVGCIPTINQPPVITSAPVTTAKVGVAYTYDVDATDPNAGDVLTYSLTTEPSGMVINGTSGVITWTPTVAESVPVTVQVSDEGGLSDTQSFTITVGVFVVELTEIVVLPETMTLFKGELKNITSVTAHYSDGSTAGIVLGDCIYGSSDEDVAKVSVAGEVTAVAEGTATITVAYIEDWTFFPDTIEVTVTKPPVYNITQDTYHITIEDAILAASDFDTIEVAAGTYEPDTGLIIDVDGLTLKSIDGATTTIIATDINPCIIISAQYVTVEGFTVKNTTVVPTGGDPDDYCIRGIELNGDNATVTDNMFYNATVYLSGGGNYSTISDNTTDEGGINFEGTISFVTITGNNISPGNICLEHGDYDDILIRENTISESSFGGIEIKSGTANNFTIIHNDITENEGGGILIASGVTSLIGSVINYNNIVGNTDYGINNASGVNVDAENNWWGHASGPKSPINPGGLGDEVTIDVEYTPWSTEEN